MRRPTTLWTALTVLLAFGVGAPSVAFAQHTTTPTPSKDLPKSLKKAADRFERKTGVALMIHLDEPAPGATGKIETGAADPGLVAKALPVLARHLQYYPAPVRKKYLDEIHVVGKLRMRGKPFLGAAVPKQKRFDVAVRNRTTPKKLASTFHHEFSHLIEADLPMPESRWTEISGKSAYKGKDHKSAYKGQSHLAAGFVTKYAARDRHEDFAELLELAYENPAKARKLADKHEKIGQKLDLLREVYAQLHPKMPLPGDGQPLKAVKPTKEERKEARLEAKAAKKAAREAKRAQS